MKLCRALTTLSLLFGLCSHAALAQDVFDENADLPAPNAAIEDQMKGEFPAMDRTVPPPLGALQRAWDEADPDAGIVRFRWEPGHSVKISTREAMTTTIRLPEWEAIETVILGDQHIYRYQQLNDNTIEVWATIPGSDTSLKILGESQNIYSFYVRSETYNSINLPDLTVYIDATAPSISGPAGATSGPSSSLMGPASQFMIGGGATPANFNGSAFTSANNPSPDWLRGIGFDPTRIKRDRAMFGDAELAPNDVFRDDQMTYLCYGEEWDDSALMVSAPYEVVDGVDRQVNFRVAHNCMIVESTGPLTLQRGDKVLCIRPDPDTMTPRRSAAAARVKPLLPQEQSAPASTSASPAPSAPVPTDGAVPSSAPVEPLAPAATPAAGTSPKSPERVGK